MMKMASLLLLAIAMAATTGVMAAGPAPTYTGLDLEYIRTSVHPLWLRERCREDFYADPDTYQPRYNLHEEVEDLKIKSIQEKKDEEDVIVVTFSDGKACSLTHHTLLAEQQQEPTFMQTLEWGVPARNLWNSTSLITPPVFEHDDIINESDETRKFLSILISTGVAVVENVPQVEGECTRFGERFTSMRTTEWGAVFNVRKTPDTNGDREVKTVRKDLAYTGNSIGMHVDSPYRVDTPPAFQLLHAMVHCDPADEGCQVHNLLVDGFAVAQELCHINRAYFDILASTTLRWENDGGDDSSLSYRYAPMIELEYDYHTSKEHCPKVSAINFSAKSGGYAPPLSKDQLEVFYQAKRLFSGMLHDDKTHAVRVQLYPGALLIFDNRRVLHARSEIHDSDGARWLQGCYGNRDGIHFNYERLRRTWSNLTETPFHSLGTAQRADLDRMGEEYDVAVTQKTKANLINLLESQKDAYLGQPISLYEHNLQTASRALRAGEDDETVFMSLFHDVFETLVVKNHGDLIAAMLIPWISPKNQWLLSHHEVFQGYYYFDKYGRDKNLRDMYKGEEEYYNWTARWCDLHDEPSFDPDYASLPLSHFIPIIDRVLAKPQYWWNPEHPKAGAITKDSGKVKVN